MKIVTVILTVILLLTALPYAVAQDLDDLSCDNLEPWLALIENGVNENMRDMVNIIDEDQRNPATISRMYIQLNTFNASIMNSWTVSACNHQMLEFNYSAMVINSAWEDILFMQVLGTLSDADDREELAAGMQARVDRIVEYNERLKELLEELREE